MNRLEPAIVAAIESRVRRGWSERAIARDLEIAKGTVTRYKRMILASMVVTVICPCGKKAFHRGWCSARYAQSPRRKQFMRKWRQK